jgi:YD repeat-containing protein
MGWIRKWRLPLWLQPCGENAVEPFWVSFSTLLSELHHGKSTAQQPWYDVRIVADGANVTVWRGEKGGAMEKILETSSASITTTSYLRFENAPYSDYRVDDIQLIGGSLSNTTTAFTYDSGNEMSTRTLNSVTTHFTYDAWGRMASKYVADGVSASYAWRYGDKLYSVTSNFPSESSVTYDYGGDQKRRERTAGGTTVKYNWDIGWNLINQESSGGTLAESYVIGNPNAEVATLLGMVSGSNPSTGTYAYFAHDHLGSVRNV